MRKGPADVRALAEWYGREAGRAGWSSAMRACSL
jgi:hypothetical protein